MKSPKLTWAFAAALLAIVPATSFPGIMFATSTDSSLLGGLTGLPFDPKTAVTVRSRPSTGAFLGRLP
jgi:hypothetical protein